MIAAPMFHALGFAHVVLGARRWARRSSCAGASTPRRRCARSTSTACTALVVVPVMLQRILELGPRSCARYDTRPLRVIAASGSRAAGRAGDARDGRASATSSTTSTARPRSPGPRSPRPRTCAPRPAARAGRRSARSCGSYDDDGARGRARARPAASSSATSSSSRATPAAAARRSSTGCMSTGDVGHFDADGRLFIDGRDDEMIVSGGENVFPREVEERSPPTPASRRRRRRRRPTRSSASGCGLRRPAPAAELTERRGQGPRQGEPGALQGAARHRLPRRAAAQPHRQGAQARARRTARDGRLRAAT